MCAIARERDRRAERYRDRQAERERGREDSNVKKKTNKRSVICSTTTKYKQTFSVTANVR